MSNYSFETSYPPFEENKIFNKKTQCDEVLALIKKGSNNLLQLHFATGLPQSTIAARVNDLIEEQKIKYEGS
jgi:predicted transcriptional regulator